MTHSSDKTHVLSFATDESGGMVSIHVDLAGVNLLLAELERIRDRLVEDDCPHTHLFGESAGGSGELTETKLSSQPNEVSSVMHVKIYGWNEEWAIKHGLKTAESN